MKYWYLSTDYVYASKKQIELVYADLRRMQLG